jgi:hypothetical protein
VIELAVESRLVVAPQHSHQVDVFVGRFAAMLVVGFDRVERFFNQPTPAPIVTRPPVSTSMVEIIFAAITGLR